MYASDFRGHIFITDMSNIVLKLLLLLTFWTLLLLLLVIGIAKTAMTNSQLRIAIGIAKRISQLLLLLLISIAKRLLKRAH